MRPAIGPKELGGPGEVQLAEVAYRLDSRLEIILPPGGGEAPGAGAGPEELPEAPALASALRRLDPGLQLLGPADLVQAVLGGAWGRVEAALLAILKPA